MTRFAWPSLELEIRIRFQLRSRRGKPTRHAGQVVHVQILQWDARTDRRTFTGPRFQRMFRSESAALACTHRTLVVAVLSPFYCFCATAPRYVG